MSNASPLSLSREDISSMLAQCDSESLQNIIDSLLNRDLLGNIEVIRPPSTGTVQLQVREPICEERFIVGDALVTVAEVSVGTSLGWAMRLGDDAVGAVAAAIADAHIAQVGLHMVPELSDLVHTTMAELKAFEKQEWAEIQGTVIDFEELD
jgi:alpha-D-ribose 1-methylphosphonate 5-triphosphate synthase subunit PhnG